MALLLVDSLAQNNSRFVQILGKILEVLFLSVGVISTLGVMKEPVLCSLMKLVSCGRSFLSSPPTIILLIINLMVALIHASSAFFGDARETETTTLLDLHLDLHVDHHESTTLGLIPTTPPRTRNNQAHIPQPHDHDQDLVHIAHHESPLTPPPRTRNKQALQPQPHDLVHIAHQESPLAPTPRTRNNQALIPQPHDLDLVHIAHQESLLAPPPRTRNKQALQPQPHDLVHIAHHESPLTPSPRTRNNQALIPQPHDHDLFHIAYQESLLTPPPRTRSNNTIIPQAHSLHTTPSSSRSTDDIWKEVFIVKDDIKEVITGGEEKPMKKQLKKSATWEEVEPKWKEFNKAETFNDALSVIRRGGMIRREPFMSMEEFNHKVEAFIQNFNNDIRLQGQEYHHRFLEKINY